MKGSTLHATRKFAENDERAFCASGSPFYESRVNESSPIYSRLKLREANMGSRDEVPWLGFGDDNPQRSPGKESMKYNHVVFDIISR